MTHNVTAQCDYCVAVVCGRLFHINQTLVKLLYWCHYDSALRVKTVVRNQIDYSWRLWGHLRVYSVEKGHSAE